MARKNRFQSIRLWGLAMILVAGPVLALGLGNILVSSHLDELFSAVIPLTVDSPSDLDGLNVSLASEQAFRRVGIEQTDALSTLHFTVQTEGNRSVIVVKSDKPIREPFLNFLVQAQWNGGTLLREYTVLMNPPNLNAGSSPAPAAQVVNSAPSSVVTPAVVPKPPVRRRHRSVAKPRSEAPAVVQSAAGAAPTMHTSEAAFDSSITDGSRYGPVKSGETLWSIAERARPSAAINTDQVMLSIYDANRSAFTQGRIDGLMKDSMLDIPSAASMRAVSAADAIARIQALNNGHVPQIPPTHEHLVAKPAAPAEPAVVKPAVAAMSSPAATASSATPGAASISPANGSAAATAAASLGAANAAPAAAASSLSESMPAQGQAALSTIQTASSVAAPAIAGAAAAASSVAGAGVATSVATSTAPAAAASSSSESMPTQSQAALSTIQTASSVAAPAIAGAAAASSVAEAGVAALTAPAAAASSLSESMPTQGQAALSTIQTASSVAAPVIANPATASSVTQAGAAPAVATSTAPAAVASASAPATATAANKPAGKITPAPTKTAVAPRPSQHQVGFLERWRLPLLGLLVILLLLVLLLRNRRSRADRDGGFTPPERPPIGPKVAPSQAAVDVDSSASEDKTSGLGAVAAVAGVVGAVAAENVSSGNVGHGLAAMRDKDESFDQTADGDAQILDVGTDSADSGNDPDPLAEADFHLAYGLYDEAIQLLKNALVQTPQRMDLKLKLAQCYAAAGKPIEYQELAKELQPEASSEQWSHIAQVGRKLCPGVALFGSVQTASADAHEVPDVTEPAVTEPDAAEPASLDQDENAEPEQIPGDNVIDFDSPQMEPVADEPSPSSVGAKTPDSAEAQSRDVAPDLSDFDSFGTRPTSTDENRVDFKLDAIDLSEPGEAGIKPVQQEPVAEEHFAISDDEFTTKLDLARAYSDMGDNEAARSLLEEVVQGGNATQKSEAEALVRQLAD